MKIERQDDLAILRLEGPRANAIGDAWLAALGRLLDESEGARALVLVGHERFFSAGLDLPSLVGLDRAAMGRFIGAFDATMLRVFEIERPVIAAVNGHAIAGGCVLALQCDWRVMSEGKIGLNEVALGIGLPTGVVESLRAAVPAASLGPVALEARLVEPEEARRLGLVDELAAPAELLGRATAKARELAALPSLAFAQVKRALRRPAIAAIRTHGAEERDAWLDTWFSDEGRRRVGEAVARLTRKK
jgi:enoyl-CoA hydratase